jgi:hypothetical protein
MLLHAIERDSLFSVIAGPLIWSVHFLSIYVFTAIACAHGFFDHQVLGTNVVRLVGGAATLVAVILILDAGFVSWRRWRGEPVVGQPEPLPPHDTNDVASRRRFMAYAGLLLSGVSLIATVWESLPLVFFASCR